MLNEENDSLKQIELFKLKIEEKGFVHQSLLEYLDISAGEYDQKTKKAENFEEIYIKNIREKINKKYDFRDFLETVSHFWRMHQPKKDVNFKIQSLFSILKRDINYIFSEEEIFNIFFLCHNYFFLVILVEQNILSVETVINIICKDESKYFYCWEFFYPEIREYNEEYFDGLNAKWYFKQFFEENDQNLDLFFKMRKEGEIVTGIIEIIREDKIEEFISLVEHSPINLNRKITSIGEDTILAIYPKYLTPIEYSAFYGSIAIFKYLYMREVDINCTFRYDRYNIIIYAIQGRNYDIIHILEELKEIEEELNNQEHQQKYLEISIKMHHNEITEYLITNYDFQVTEKIINYIIQFRNYQLLYQLIDKNQIDIHNIQTISLLFSIFCYDGNEEIVNILINLPNIDINFKDEIFKNINNNKT